MKPLVFVLAIVATIFGLLYLQSTTQTAPAPVPAAALVVTQLVERPAITAEVERTVTVLVTNTVELESRLAELQTNLARTSQSLQRHEAKSDSLEKDKLGLQERLGVVSNELVAVQQQYAQLKTENTATEADLRKVQAEQSSLELKRIALETEKASLERRLNSLEELYAQIRLLKQEARARKIADWRQADAVAAQGGNRGYLKRQGAYTDTATNQPAGQ